MNGYKVTCSDGGPEKGRRFSVAAKNMAEAIVASGHLLRGWVSGAVAAVHHIEIHDLGELITPSGCSCGEATGTRAYGAPKCAYCATGAAPEKVVGQCIRHVNCGGGQHDPSCPRSRP